MWLNKAKKWIFSQLNKGIIYHQLIITTIFKSLVQENNSFSKNIWFYWGFFSFSFCFILLILDIWVLATMKQVHYIVFTFWVWWDACIHMQYITWSGLLLVDGLPGNRSLGFLLGLRKAALDEWSLDSVSPTAPTLRESSLPLVLLLGDNVIHWVKVLKDTF
jgi:hypothetical protein